MEGIFRYDDSALDIESNSLRDNYYAKANYKFEEFKNDVYKAIETYYDNNSAYFRKGNKSIKIKHNKAEADIIACFSYKKFFTFTGDPKNPKIIKGISFDTKNGVTITSYPKLHLDACNKKEEETHKKYKSIIRVFKNIKSILVDRKIIENNLACSYYIENLLYNCHNSIFLCNDSFSSLVKNICDSLIKECNNGSFELANKQGLLFCQEAWNLDDCSKFLEQVNKYLIEYN